MLTLDFAFLAASAVVRDGLISVLDAGVNGFATQPLAPGQPPIKTNDGPSVGAPIAFAIVTRFQFDEAAPRRLRVASTTVQMPTPSSHDVAFLVETAAGQRLFQGGINVASTTQSLGGEPANLPLTMQVVIAPITLGRHNVKILVDGDVVKTIGFGISLAQAPNGADAGGR